MSADYETVINQFGEFGVTDATVIYPASPIRAKVNSAWMEWRLTVYLQPCYRGQTDVDYRRAAFELSERAIAFAREHYRLVSAPEFSMTGHLQFDGEINCIDARLDLEFTEK
jgi:hypothetical protein